MDTKLTLPRGMTALPTCMIVMDDTGFWVRTERGRDIDTTENLCVTLPGAARKAKARGLHPTHWVDLRSAPYVSLLPSAIQAIFRA